MNGEGAYQFVDTNVLVYAYDRSAGKKHEQARALLAELWASGNGRLSIQVLQEFYVVISRKIGKPLSPENAAQIVADLGTWEHHAPGLQDLQDAIRLQTRYQLSFWDAMIVASAQHLRCPLLWSEDLNDGQRFGDVLVKNPFAT
jgi:predicted nucleic acid-binding protein